VCILSVSKYRLYYLINQLNSLYFLSLTVISLKVSAHERTFIQFPATRMVRFTILIIGFFNQHFKYITPVLVKMLSSLCSTSHELPLKLNVSQIGSIPRCTILGYIDFHRTTPDFYFRCSTPSNFSFNCSNSIAGSKYG